MSLYNYKGRLSSFILWWRKWSLKLDLNKSEFLKRFFLKFICFWLSIYNYIEQTWSFMVIKMFIEIRLGNLMAYAFRGHLKIVKIFVVNLSLLKHNQNGFEKFIKVKWFCLINTKKGINTEGIRSEDFFIQKISGHIWIWKGIRNYFSVT